MRKKVANFLSSYMTNLISLSIFPYSRLFNHRLKYIGLALLKRAPSIHLQILFHNSILNNINVIRQLIFQSHLCSIHFLYHSKQLYGILFLLILEYCYYKRIFYFMITNYCTYFKKVTLYNDITHYF